MSDVGDLTKIIFTKIASCDGVVVVVVVVVVVGRWGRGGEGGLCLVLMVHCHKRIFASIDLGYSFKYHRIDLDPPQHPCLHFGKTVTSGEYN